MGGGLRDVGLLCGFCRVGTRLDLGVEVEFRVLL